MSGWIKIIVSSMPATRRFADDIGTDGYGEISVSAVALLRSLLRK
jgi:hypothetical protein